MNSHSLIIAELKTRAYSELGPDAFERTAIWGTYGKEGKGPIEWVLLHERETDHLQAIIRTQICLASRYHNIICRILESRNVAPESYDHEAALVWQKKMIESPDTDPELLGMVKNNRS